MLELVQGAIGVVLFIAILASSCSSTRSATS